jgi:hypothetical protein
MPYLNLNSAGQLAEKNFTVQSTGTANAGDGVGLDTSGKLDASVMPVGIGANTTIAIASEALASGDWVNFWNNSGTLSVRKADASGGYGKKADGFVLSGVSSGQNATVYKGGDNTALSGLTPGTVYFLSAATPGSVAIAPPSTTGQLWQILGKAVSTTAISYQRTEPIIRA